MVNPFSGIVSSEFKEVFNNAISALVDASGVAIPCTLYYGVTKYEACANCVYDPIGKKEMTPKLRRANSIVVATNISGYFPHRYERVSEPTPMGLGNTEFVVCTWKRIG